MVVYTYPLEDGLVAFRPGITGLFVLNETAALIWKDLEGGCSYEKIAARMAARYNIHEDKARKDVAQALDAWVMHGLLGNETLTKAQNGQTDQSLPAFAGTVENAPPVIFEYRAYKMFDTAFAIGYGSPELKQLMHPLFQYYEVPFRSSEKIRIQVRRTNSLYVVTRNGTVTGQDARLHEAAGIVIKEILSVLYSDRVWMAVLHGAAVHRDGKGILFPGEGGNGKTTLTAALVQCGFDYLNDDTVPLDAETGRFAAFPAGLCLKEGSWQILGPDYPEIDALPVYQRYGKSVRYLPLKSDAVTKGMRLVSANLLVFPEHVRRFVEWIQRIPCYQLSYGVLSSGMKLIQRHVNSGSL